MEREEQTRLARQLLESGALSEESSNAIKADFPELAESEDDRIRKEIISFIKEFEKDHYKCIDFSSWIAYLEKQKEQKPAEWSEEDAYMLDRCADSIRMYRDCIAKLYPNESRDVNDKYNPYNEEIDWVKHLSERFNLQPKQEWSGEDSRILHNVITYVGYAAGQRGVRDDAFKEANDWLKSLPIGFIVNPHYNQDMIDLLIGELQQIAKDNNAPGQYDAEINWLKSLRPQPHWKPSEEQIGALERAIVKMHTPTDIGILAELRDNLKKLQL